MQKYINAVSKNKITHFVHTFAELKKIDCKKCKKILDDAGIR